MVLHMGGRTYQQQHTKHLLMLGQIVGLVQTLCGSWPVVLHITHSGNHLQWLWTCD